MEDMFLEIIKNPLYVLSFLLLYLIMKVEKVISQNTIALEKLEEYIRTKDGILEEHLKELKEVILWIKSKLLTN